MPPHVRVVNACKVIIRGIGAVVPAAAGALFAADPVDEAGKTVGEWVKTRAEIIRLEEKWGEEKALLGATVGAMKERAAQLQEKRDHLLAKTAEERAELVELGGRRDKARESLDKAESALEATTEQLVALRPRLPPRLSSALEMAFRSLSNAGLSPGERMQLVMTALNRCTQFNSSLEHGEEVVQFAGESTPLVVDVIYWGLSHGYALDRSTGRTWLGFPTGDRWTWEQVEGAAGQVAELMAIHRDETEPSLVAIPAKLGGAGEAGR